MKFRFMLFAAISFLSVSCEFIEERKIAKAKIMHSDIIESCEKKLLYEMKNIPDFSTQPLTVELPPQKGIDEPVQWLTSTSNPFGSQNAVQGGAFYTYLHDFPNTFRYCGPGADNTSKRLFWTHIPLVRRSPEDGFFLPAAATHWAFSNDGKTVYFKLNENAKWSDGSPCDADDFIFAAQFMSSKSIIDGWENNRFSKLTVKKINRYCIAVTYSGECYNCPNMLLQMVNFKPRAKHFYSGVVPENWITEYNRIVEPTTGAYFLENYNSNYGLSFKKVENWWGYEYPHYQGMFNFDKIEMRILPGTQRSLRTYFCNERLDAMPLVTSDEWLNASNDFRVKSGLAEVWTAHYCKPAGMSGIFFNVEKPPFNNVNVRKGMYYAIDMQGMIDTVLMSKCSRMNGIGAFQNEYGISFNDPSIKMPSFDPAKAGEFFDAAGYNLFDGNGIRMNAAGEKLHFSILYSDISLKDCFGYLYPQALKAGVAVSPHFMSGGILKKVISGNFHAWWGNREAAAIPNYYTFFHSKYKNSQSINNFFNYSNPEMDNLLEEYENSSLTLTEKAALNKKIERLVFDEALFVPSYSMNYSGLIAWKWIRFPGWLNQKLTDNFADPFASLMWFDPDIKKECSKAQKHGGILEPRFWDLSRRYHGSLN